MLDEVDSTNSWLKAHAQVLENGAAVTALRQTAGRGRQGHTWLDDDGMLPLSVLLKCPPYPQTIPLAAGLAVCDVLEESFSALPQTGIKWPNDIVADGFKLCGILCESSCFGDRMDVICGVGVNLTQTREYFDAQGLPHASSIAAVCGEIPDRSVLAQALVCRITEYSRMEFARLYDMYKKRCVTLGKEVRIFNGQNERTAFAEDIAENGCLICHDENGVFEVNSGEVSVRGLYGYV